MHLKTFKWVLVVLLAIITNANAKPTVTNWDLGQDTREVLYVVPDLGVRLIFPFNLADMDPALSTTITNPVYFTVPNLTGEDGAINATILQNHLTVMVDRSAIEPLIDRMNGTLTNPLIGYLYLSTGGFNLTLELRTTLDRRQSPSNVFFQISPEKREYLISESVLRRSGAMALEYENKVASLENRAKTLALAMVGELSLKTPSVTRIRKSGTIRTGEGYVIELKAKALHQFGTFSTLQLFIINNNANAIAVKQLTLFQLDDEGSRTEISAAHRCEGIIDRFDDKECVLSTMEDAIHEAKHLLLEIDTNIGGGAVEW
ncbi:hypothetical protein [Ferrimonas balearica]|uniref:hypothetical protein n=1 Tax=Ferrimonas balearica TaxID=44012 RepID=UPI001C94226B|nr:hypothetical protein [Ferrimonas balearica]MBY5979216.1 hypothetical protein [Ferrimonas balearica]